MKKAKKKKKKKNVQHPFSDLMNHGGKKKKKNTGLVLKRDSSSFGEMAWLHTPHAASSSKQQLDHGCPGQCVILWGPVAERERRGRWVEEEEEEEKVRVVGV